jgi:hypothetical protein
MQSLTANLMAVHYPLATFTLLLLPFTVESQRGAHPFIATGQGQEN